MDKQNFSWHATPIVERIRRKKEQAQNPQLSATTRQIINEELRELVAFHDQTEYIIASLRRQLQYQKAGQSDIRRYAHWRLQRCQTLKRIAQINRLLATETLPESARQVLQQGRELEVKQLKWI